MPQEDYSLNDEVSVFADTFSGNGISLKLSDISYSYHNGTQVFEHADFEAHPHEIIALVGPSGEGKTTMLRLILSLLKPQTGTAVIYADANRNIANYHSLLPRGSYFPMFPREILCFPERLLKICVL